MGILEGGLPWNCSFFEMTALHLLLLPESFLWSHEWNALSQVLSSVSHYPKTWKVKPGCESSS